MPIVTVQGRIGSPSRILGLDVARLLGADYVDHQILAEAARRVGAPEEALAHRDERALRGRERLARFFQNFLEKSAAGSAGDPFLGPTGIEVLMSRSLAEAAQPAASGQEVGDARYKEVIISVIQDLARGGNVVIIGRGSHVVLKELPNALHVYVVSSLESRVQLIMQRENLRRAAAERYVKDNELSRVAYYKKFFNVQPEDPALYHLFLNADRLGTEQAARIVADAAKGTERQLKQQ